ncbi:polysaccharide deacetylase family protein [Rhodonellum sp.]|uniref:polysaccharide deacetylase family protein n=1 Tax=Rhodonellum sp. TaxID=2231180 RepID=UPI00271C431D|nr:polysaccharide deacetylase family protein [Rhodonellum sp.]MDO9554767.1 polysaccharide deacetylase family protein [Rhodonellum sp.]
MTKTQNFLKLGAMLSAGLFFGCDSNTIDSQNIGKTEVLPWHEGKKLAVSITYDDGTLNQFRKAIPIMNDLGMHGTIFINTGEIPGAQYSAKYIGRDILEIIAETSKSKTTEENLFERATAIRFVDLEGAVAYHDQAGALFERGRVEEACALIDKGYSEIRVKNIRQLKTPQIIDGEMIDWEEIKKYADQGHEFGVHTISHPRLAVLDEENLMYELMKCKEDIEANLGMEHTFSAECPFGTENERVMAFALKEFPALRNRMPESYLHEINRSGDFDPTYNEKEYTQWQRGPLSKTTLAEKKSWIDRSLQSANTPWLVLVYHGIDGIGWEPQSSDSIRAYFQYIHDLEEDIWVGTFGDVTKYMREKMASKVTVTPGQDEIQVELTHDLGELYDFPLTLKTYVSEDWEKTQVKQGNDVQELNVLKDKNGSYILYQAFVNKDKILISNK